MHVQHTQTDILCWTCDITRRARVVVGDGRQRRNTAVVAEVMLLVLAALVVVVLVSVEFCGGSRCWYVSCISPSVGCETNAVRG